MGENMNRKQIDLLADIYECLQEVRELSSDPPGGYTTEETLAETATKLRKLAQEADALQMELAMEWEAALDTVEARMHSQLPSRGL